MDTVSFVTPGHQQAIFRILLMNRITCQNAINTDHENKILSSDVATVAQLIAQLIAQMQPKEFPMPLVPSSQSAPKQAHSGTHSHSRLVIFFLVGGLILFGHCLLLYRSNSEETMGMLVVKFGTGNSPTPVNFLNHKEQDKYSQLRYTQFRSKDYIVYCLTSL